MTARHWVHGNFYWTGRGGRGGVNVNIHPSQLWPSVSPFRVSCATGWPLSGWHSVGKGTGEVRCSFFALPRRRGVPGTCCVYQAYAAWNWHTSTSGRLQHSFLVGCSTLTDEDPLGLDPPSCPDLALPPPSLSPWPFPGQGASLTASPSQSPCGEQDPATRLATNQL